MDMMEDLCYTTKWQINNARDSLEAVMRKIRVLKGSVWTTDRLKKD